MKYIFLLLTLPMMNQDCDKNKKDSIPACIQEKIVQIQKELKWNPPAEVNEYSYNGKKVYLFSSPVVTSTTIYTIVIANISAHQRVVIPGKVM